MNGQVEHVIGLILQIMKTRMFHDLEADGRNWHKELPLVLWALCTNVNRATKDTLFHLMCGVDVVLPPEIFLESARLVQFNEANQDEAREVDANISQEKCNIVLANVWKYQESLKHLYIKSVVPQQLEIGDIVLENISTPNTSISSHHLRKDHS
jgi:hypothetical protein